MQESGSRGNSTNTKERATHKQKRSVALGGFFLFIYFYHNSFFLSLLRVTKANNVISSTVFLSPPSIQKAGKKFERSKP